MTLGDRLRSERVRLGFSQEQLASLGGVRANAQGQYEHNKRIPRADYLTQLSALGMDVRYILLGASTTDGTQYLPPDEAIFIQSLGVLSADDSRAIRRVVTTMARAPVHDGLDSNRQWPDGDGLDGHDVLDAHLQSGLEKGDFS